MVVLMQDIFVYESNDMYSLVGNLKDAGIV